MLVTLCHEFGRELCYLAWRAFYLVFLFLLWWAVCIIFICTFGEHWDDGTRGLTRGFDLSIYLLVFMSLAVTMGDGVVLVVFVLLYFFCGTGVSYDLLLAVCVLPFSFFPYFCLIGGLRRQIIIFMGTWKLITVVGFSTLPLFSYVPYRFYYSADIGCFVSFPLCCLAFAHLVAVGAFWYLFFCCSGYSLFIFIYAGGFFFCILCLVLFI